MNPIWSFYREERLLKRRKRRRRLVCGFAVAALLLGLAWNSLYPSGDTIADNEPSARLAVVPVDPPEETTVQTKHKVEPKKAEPEQMIVTRYISAGDTLSSIFDSCEIGQTEMYQVLSADESLLALDVLRPGHKLTFTLDHETGMLVSMELFIHPGKQVAYNRVNDSGFEYEEIIIPGKWKQELLEGEITNSFYLSARSSGLNDQETGNVTGLFRDRILFSRDMRAGDHFQVIRSRQFVDGEFTGQSRIEGVRIFRGSRTHSAFLFDDGNYYDHNGENLARALRRYPMNGEYRVSSSFSPARRHPITGRVSPHNGVDFAMPTGTPIYSTGDGMVTRVQNHPFAGKYIEIQHGSQYTTRYLHLSRTLVSRGQSVERGQRIALSGNTGRSTGPHLHFELHVNGRPVNPLTAKIPMASAVPDEKRAEFNERVGELVALMERPSQEIALHRRDDNS